MGGMDRRARHAGIDRLCDSLCGHAICHRLFAGIGPELPGRRIIPPSDGDLLFHHRVVRVSSRLAKAWKFQALDDWWGWCLDAFGRCIRLGRRMLPLVRRTAAAQLGP